MKRISLRTLVREPLKVKRMTGTGQPVQVTTTASHSGFSNSFHVASGRTLESEQFLTTDARQAQLAKAEGLKVVAAGSAG